MSQDIEVSAEEAVYVIARALGMEIEEDQCFEDPYEVVQEIYADFNLEIEPDIAAALVSGMLDMVRINFSKLSGRCLAGFAVEENGHGLYLVKKDVTSEIVRMIFESITEGGKMAWGIIVGEKKYELVINEKKKKTDQVVSEEGM